MKPQPAIRQSILALGLGLGLSATLAAGEDGSGFRGLGPRTGTLFFDPQENAGPVVLLGAQGFWVFDGQRHGLALDGFHYQAKSRTLPGVKLHYSGFSASFLTGLAADSGGSMWPYLGLGLGTLRAPEIDPLTQSTARATSAHVSLGFLERLGNTFFWGLEGRAIVRFPVKSLQEIQASIHLGYTWGGRSTIPSAAPAPPPHGSGTEPSARVLPTATTPPSARPSPAQAPAQAPAAPPPTPSATPMVSPGPSAGMPTPSVPEPAPMPPVPPDSTPESRLAALRRGDIPRALELSRRYIGSLPARHWTLRLEVAWKRITLKNAAWAFPGTKADVFIAPLQLRDGTAVQQLLLGVYTSREEAELTVRTIPGYFLKTKLRPIPIQVSDLPSKICPMTKPVPVPRPTPAAAPKGIAVRPKPSCSRCH